jgi:V/A-type H+-transporting ATPase subunit E
VNQVEALEQAILKRAEEMAREQLQRGESGRSNILRESSERLQLREEKESLLAKALGDRAYLRKVQADELKLRSKLDHMRWNLVQTVMQRLAELLETLRRDEPRYHELLRDLLRQAAAEIQAQQLVVALNAEDRRQLHASWDMFTAGLRPQTQFRLADDPIETVGGLLVSTPDGRIRIDHTFEGRMERLQNPIRQALVERLLPPVGSSLPF